MHGAARRSNGRISGLRRDIRAQALPGFFQLAWSFKFVIGAAQDATPVGGLHRAPYVLAGWAGCVGLGCALAVFADRLAMLPYAGIVCALEACMVCADTACDALVVGLTKTEAEDVRGFRRRRPAAVFETENAP